MSRVLPCGERSLLVELEGGHDVVHRFAELARERLGRDLEDVVPGHRTVLVVGRERGPDVDVLLELVETASRRPCSAPAADEPVVLPVRYDGPDIAEVARIAGLSPEEVVRRHLAASYTVAFVGFAPGFAYMVGGDPRLAVPRRREPRARVPAGSVAIAGPYSAVYPAASPGGWRLLGTTSAVMFDPSGKRPALLEAGSAVRFREDA